MHDKYPIVLEGMYFFQQPKLNKRDLSSKILDFVPKKMPLGIVLSNVHSLSSTEAFIWNFFGGQSIYC